MPLSNSVNVPSSEIASIRLCADSAICWSQLKHTFKFSANSFVYIIFLHFGHFVIIPAGSSLCFESETVTYFFFLLLRLKKSLNIGKPPHNHCCLPYTSHAIFQD